MEHKLYDSELKVMEVLWREGDQTAKAISEELKRTTGWNMNTTYTVIKKCIAKGAIERREPGFQCHALLAREEVQDWETDALLTRLFNGSADQLFASLLGRKKLSKHKLAELRQLVDELEEEE